MFSEAVQDEQYFAACHRDVAKSVLAYVRPGLFLESLLGILLQAKRAAPLSWTVFLD